MSRSLKASAANHLASDLPGHTVCGRKLMGHYRTFDTGRITCGLCLKATDSGGFDAKVYAEILAEKVSRASQAAPIVHRDWLVVSEHFREVSYTHGPVSGTRCGGGVRRTMIRKKGSR